MDVVYLDLSKAVGTVSHKIPIGKLRQCGSDERAMGWVENWLTAELRGL